MKILNYILLYSIFYANSRLFFNQSRGQLIRVFEINLHREGMKIGGGNAYITKEVFIFLSLQNECILYRFNIEANATI